MLLCDAIEPPITVMLQEKLAYYFIPLFCHFLLYTLQTPSIKGESTFSKGLQIKVSSECDKFCLFTLATCAVE